MNGRRAGALVAAVAALAAVPAAGGTAAPADAGSGAGAVVVSPGVVRVFRPDRALGAGLDGHEHGDIRRIYTPSNIRKMASSGLASISLRLRTELGVDAWHWNPVGRWSDPRHHRGYWTSSATSRRPIGVSYGYALPRRGDTVDQAEDDGYSRLDDGEPRTFWKSNPYLDSRYTRQSDAAHPQWVLVDFGAHVPVDAIRIAWGAPFATRFTVQSWTGPEAVQMAGHAPGRWVGFTRSRFSGRGGVQTLRLASAPRRVRFVRVLLEWGSRTAPAGSADIRDHLGYAIRELGVGRLTGGRFHDLVHHRPNARQTVTMASSTDPWHTANDLDPNVEQPGFSRVLASGLTGAWALLAPVAVLYGTPADAVAELRWLRSHHVALRGLELGEEPDGQLASPEDYGALYAEYARALRKVDPSVPLGGPGYETQVPDWPAWPDRGGDRSYTRRFLAELRSQHALGRLGFFSFEWYPFDNGCADPGPQLRRNPGMLARQLERQYEHGLPRSVPMLVTEYGMSAFATRDEVDLAGALFDADTAAHLLELGADGSFLYGLEPDQLISELPCHSYGNLTLWLSRSDRTIKHPTAALWAMRMLTGDWAMPGDGAHALLRTTVSQPSGAAGATLGAYAVRRPDGRLAVLLVNRDLQAAHDVSLAGLGTGPLDRWTLSSADYRWHPAGFGGFPAPDAPPVADRVSAARTLKLPPGSVTVLRTTA